MVRQQRGEDRGEFETENRDITICSTVILLKGGDPEDPVTHAFRVDRTGIEILADAE